MNHNKIEYIIGLLNKKKENKKLEEWLSDEKNRKMFYKICETREALLKYIKPAKVDIDAELKLLNKAINKTSSLKFSRWASVVASLLVIAGFYFFFIAERDPKENSAIVSQFTEMSPPRAQLMLDNGEVIDLTKENMNITDGKFLGITNDSLHGLQYSQLRFTETAKPIFNTVKVPVGGAYKMTLSDGTGVWLNSQTEIRFPVHFTGNKRKIFLKGEAYFKVAHDAERTFIAHLPKGRIEVLGTEFNVSAYDDEQEMLATLLKGSVKFIANSNEKGQVLQPNQQISYHKESCKLVLKNIDPYPFIAWKEGKFYFKSMELDKMLRQLKRWYDFKVYYRDEALKHYKFRGVILKESPLNEALKIIEETTDIKFKIKNNTVEVYKEC